jgi:A/G-specific adenine glycosylase
MFVSIKVVGERKNNPNRKSAHYIRQSKFEGSNREIRGKMIKLFIKRRILGIKEIKKLIVVEEKRIDSNLKALAKEGFIRTQKGKCTLL